MAASDMEMFEAQERIAALEAEVERLRAANAEDARAANEWRKLGAALVALSKEVGE